jgi:hypothetical protein
MDVIDVMDTAIKSTVPSDSVKVKKESTIYELPNFLSHRLCDEIVMWFKTEPKVASNIQSFFNGRQINYENISNDRIKKIVNMFRYETSKEIEKLFSVKAYPDYTDIVYWASGSGMLVHSDNSDQDGNPNYCAWREFSGVLYLNDDYQGGNTFFPDHGPKFVVPEKGKLVLFPAGIDYNHGVTTVVGNRYTMPIWFTSDINHIEK